MSLNTSNFSYATFLSSMDYGISTGSGFRLVDEKREFLITARHVLFDQDNQLRCDSFLSTSQNSIGEPNDARTIIVNLTKSKIIKYDKFDIACVELVEGHNYDVQQPGLNIVSATISDLLPLDKIIISSTIISVGFPTSLYLEGFKFFDINRPLLRKGIVAGIHGKENTFIVDCPAFYGNSGGPVIRQEESGETKIIGIISRYIPFVTEWRNKHEREFTREEFYNSGYAICVPLDSVIDQISENNSVVK